MQIINVRKIRKESILLGLIFLFGILSLDTQAQNMPYSQRGIGNPVHSRNLLNVAMGGVSEAYSDGQSLNFVNPASYANLRLTTLDVGFNAGTLNLHNQDTASFHSGFGSISYLQIGVPLKKGGGWGLVFGLVPQTKVNYRISKIDTLPGISENSMNLYKGKGGAYKAFVGTAYEIKGFRFGVNFGYLFGSKRNNIQAVYPNDTSAFFNAHQRVRIGYSSFFTDFGIQKDIKLKKNLYLKLGVSGGLQSNLKAKKDFLLETFNYAGDPADQDPKNQDTAFYKTGEKGTIVYPAHYGAGFLLQNSKGKGNWSIGADYETTEWSSFKSYGASDHLRDSRTIRLGAQFVPGARSGQGSYWEGVSYRLGYYNTRKNFVNNGSGVNEYAFSLGFGLPARNHVRSNQFTMINLALEVGKRGTKANKLNASFVRFSLGFSFSDIWFIERKYQ